MGQICLRTFSVEFQVWCEGRGGWVYYVLLESGSDRRCIRRSESGLNRKVGQVD